MRVIIAYGISLLVEIIKPTPSITKKVALPILILSSFFRAATMLLFGWIGSYFV
jgi:hypothetical protein